MVEQSLGIFSLAWTQTPGERTPVTWESADEHHTFSLKHVLEPRKH